MLGEENYILLARRWGAQYTFFCMSEDHYQENRCSLGVVHIDTVCTRITVNKCNVFSAVGLW